MNKSFKEKWEDKKYQAKVKLSGYGIFVVIAIVLIIIGSFNGNTNSDINSDDINNLKDNNNISFEIDYPYKKEIVYVNEKIENKIIYSYVENDNELLITKENNGVITNYKYINDRYYIESNSNYILTSVNKVYDNLYDYLDMDNINNYLANSILSNNKYIVYLKDIILGSDSDLYITLSIDNDILEIDYTCLFNYLDNKNYDSYIVKISK